MKELLIIFLLIQLDKSGFHFLEPTNAPFEKKLPFF